MESITKHKGKLVMNKIKKVFSTIGLVLVYPLVKKFTFPSKYDLTLKEAIKKVWTLDDIKSN